MYRFAKVTILSFTSLLSLQAANVGINPGDILLPNGSVAIGLLPAATASGVNALGNSGQATPEVSVTPISGPAGWITKNNLSQSAMIGGNTSVSMPQGATPGANGTAACPTITVCQNSVFGPGSLNYIPVAGPTFDLLGDNTSTSKQSWTSNATAGVSGPWEVAPSGSTTITIPIGIFGVSKVYTMLQEVQGIAGSYLTVQLGFGSTATAGLADVGVESLLLTNGVLVRNIMSGACAGCLGTLGSQTFTSGISGSYTATAANIWSATATSGPNLGNTVVFDYQSLPVFSEFQNSYLNYIKIIDTGSAAKSQGILSAVTVQTPEPSTVLLFLSGLGALGFARYRRKA